MNTTKVKKDEFINAGSEIQEELLSHFSKSQVLEILDIGACDGLTSIIYSRLFPYAHVIAFEAIEENYLECKKNFEEYETGDMCTPVHIALGSKAGSVNFYKSSGEAPGVKDWNTGNKSSSLLKPKVHLKEHGWCEFNNSEWVEMRTLDSYGLYPDFIHIDVQGAELEVAKGGKNTFKRAKLIWMEVSNIELYEKQPLKQDIMRYMDRIGFRCIKDTCKNKKYGDTLWLKR